MLIIHEGKSLELNPSGIIHTNGGIIGNRLTWIRPAFHTNGWNLNGLFAALVQSTKCFTYRARLNVKAV